MRNLKYDLIGVVYLTPDQKRARYIRQLERWVIALGAVCILMAVVICILLAASVG